MLLSLSGKNIVEGLLVIIRCKECKQILGVPKLTAGTEDKQAEMCIINRYIGN